MNATHLKIGRKLGKKLYMKSNGIGNGIIYIVRRDMTQDPCHGRHSSRFCSVFESPLRCSNEAVLSWPLDLPNVHPVPVQRDRDRDLLLPDDDDEDEPDDDDEDELEALRLRRRFDAGDLSREREERPPPPPPPRLPSGFRPPPSAASRRGGDREERRGGERERERRRGGERERRRGGERERRRTGERDERRRTGERESEPGDFDRGVKERLGRRPRRSPLVLRRRTGLRPGLSRPRPR